MKRKMKKNAKMAAGIGAGVLTAAALTAAAAYLLSDKKTMRRAKAWAQKARKEVAKNVKATRKMSEKEYARIVDKATKHYAQLHEVTAPELRRAATDLKAEWKRLRKDAKVVAKMVQARKPKARTKAGKARRRKR